MLGALAALLIAAGFLLWGSVGDARHADRDAAVSDADTALDPRGVAVLPFLNLSLDPEQEYFSDGITEDLLTNLSRIDGLRVISRTSSWQYKGVARPMARVARELGVAYVVEGSVRRDGEQLRITAQLIDAATDTHLWAETYDRELGGIFQIQSEIAQRIAEQLRQRLSPADRERIAAGGTGNPTAYDLLLRGREYLNRPGPADVRKYGPAMSFFRQALELDPGYARAYVGLSEAYRNHVALPLPMRRDSVLAFARKAVELDPESAEAAAALGWASLLARDWPAAEQAFRRALEREPNQVAALSGRARLAWLNGRLDDAVRWQRRAVAVDPASGQQLTTLGGFLLDLGDLAGARAAYRRAVELAPDAPVSSFMLAQIHLIQGEEEEAEERMRALAAASSDHPGTQFLLGRFYAQRGRFAEAQAPLARAAEALAGGATGTVALQQAYVAQRLGESERAAVLLRRAEVDLATHERDGTYAARLLLQLHALRGERERAVELLRWQWEQGSGAGVLDGPQLGLYWLDRDPLLEELRSDPAFQHHLRRIRAERDSMRLLPDR